jgi:hypothetical protein
MRATIAVLASLLWTAATATAVQADQPYCFYLSSVRVAPDACGPGYYCTNSSGAVYGPNYSVRPGFEPWQGFRPCQSNCQGQAGFPAHPFVRSPRDYFMVD